MKDAQIREPIVLLNSYSPICQIEAIAEDNGDCIYFYLYGQEGPEQFMRSCWVCNKTAAPKEMDTDAMEAGCAPKMPEDCCGHPQGIETPQGLEIVWFEEGDAAALLSNGSLLAVIPGWAGTNDFPGYSRYCTEVNMLAWPLTPEAEKNLMARVDAGREWGAYISGDFWPQLQAQCMAAAENYFGAHERYFAIDGGNFPPKALVTGRKGNAQYATTLGVCLFPMPKTEQAPEGFDPPARRIELAFAWEEGSLHEHEMPMLSYISFISALPWQNITYLDDQHTIPCEAIPGFSAVLLHAGSKGEEGVQFPDFRGDRIETLWLIPLTGDEYKLAVEQGSDVLLEKASERSIQELTTFSGKAKFIG